MIPHAEHSHRAETLPVRATGVRTPFARKLTEGLNIASRKLRFPRPPGAKSRSLHPPRRDRRPDAAIITLGQKPKSP
jgi:hypothetical protein